MATLSKLPLTTYHRAQASFSLSAASTPVAGRRGSPGSPR